MTPPAYQGRHRRSAQSIRKAHLLQTGHELGGRYVLRNRLSPPDPVSFRADDSLLNRSVTVTFLNLDSDYAELIHGSDRMPGISGLQHPALASLFDVGHEADVQESYIVTDYLESSPLSELIEQQPVGQDPHPLSAHVAELLADLASYLSAHGLEHRDLSPANIRIALPSQGTDSASAPAEHPLVRVGLIGLHANVAEPADETRRSSAQPRTPT
jgi:serine/threonine protein kinase